MGMYTTLKLEAPLSPEGRIVIEALHRSMAGSDQNIWIGAAILGDSEDTVSPQVLAAMRKWSQVGRSNFIPNGMVTYHSSWGTENVNTVDENGVWHVLCSLKNYEGEIETFLETLLPCLISRPTIAQSWYEEDEEPTALAVVPLGWHEPIPDFDPPGNLCD